MNWKNELDIGTESELITNPYTGESCALSPEAVSVYDFIKGNEFLISNDCNTVDIITNFYDALGYFQEKWPNEYMILLD